MSNSRLLSSHYSDDDEYTLDAVHDRSSYTAHRFDFAPRDRSISSNGEDEEEDTLEAPSSLMIERHISPTEQQSTREYVSVYDRTMWRWANVENMDDFFQRVYDYFQGKGLYCILLARLLNLMTLVFMIVFSTFLVGCVNYSEIPSHHKLSQVIEPQCISKLSTTKFLFLLIFIIWWVWQAYRFVTDLPALREMHNFYTHLLKIPDQDMQTVSWQTVLDRIISIRETNPNTAEQSPIRLTEHDVASRIMRKENYLIALFNKDILNITIPLPLLRDRHVFTKDLEWNLSFCLLGFVFDQRGQVRKRFLKEKNKHLLVAGLKRRFIFMGLLNFLLSPFIFGYLLFYFFFRYFEEYHKNPGEIGSRNYTPFAKWKFREFNELPHLFRTRISQSYEPANLYINQFPKEKTVLFARFVSFIAGSFAGVLALFSLFDSEALLSFEIVPNGTVLFFLGITGTIFAVTRGMIPDENQVFEPERLLKQVVEHTHYLPSTWRHKLHTDQIRGEFCELFDYKVAVFLQELLSVVFAPFVLCLSLPTSAEQIVNFFREFTVHVQGLGYVCSFAQFDFERHGNVKYGVPGAVVDDDYYLSQGGKMEKSFLNFKTNNPNWEPTDMAGSMYLSRLARFKNQKPNMNSTGIEEEDEQAQSDSIQDGMLQSSYSSSHHPGAYLSSSAAAFPSTSQFVPNAMNSSPPDRNGPDYNDTETSSPMRLNQYGVPDIIPSNLGESYEESQRWNTRMLQEEEEGETSNRGEGMIGLLNQFYDLNNNPTV